MTIEGQFHTKLANAADFSKRAAKRAVQKAMPVESTERIVLEAEMQLLIGMAFERAARIGRAYERQLQRTEADAWLATTPPAPEPKPDLNPHFDDEKTEPMAQRLFWPR